jgi:hypothetical protein
LVYSLYRLKKSATLILLLIFISIQCSLGSKTAKDETNSRGNLYHRYSPQQLSNDLDQLFVRLGNIHPNLYANIEKDSIEHYRVAVSKNLNHPMTSLVFWKLVAPLVTRFKDGHTSLYFPYQFRQDYLDNGGTIFPFEVSIDGDRIFVAKNYALDSLLIVNSEILSINSILSNEILHELRKYQGGERLPFVNLNIEKRFKLWLWAIFGYEENFQIDFISDFDGKSYCKQFSGITLNEFRSFQDSVQTVQSPYSYNKPGNEIGLIDFRRMVEPGRFKKFLKSTFTNIQHDSIHSLIIDIRRNGGGDSRLVDDLFKYTTDKPYTQAVKMDIKVSKEARQFLKRKYLKWYMYPLYPLAYFYPPVKPLFFGKIGRIEELEFQLQKPKNNSLFFEGDVYLLIGPNTFSSANILADMIKCYQIGTVIGEETGGLTIAFGDIIPFQLSNTKLNGGCSFKKFYHPCGKSDGHGVIPDIEVKQNAADLKKGIDTVMEFTIEYIKNKH